MLITKLMVVT